MLTALIFVLTLAALALLMLVERMGLPAIVAVEGSYVIIGLAALALAIVNTTSRLGRFMIGHERGAALSSTALVAALVLTGLTVVLPLGKPLLMLLALLTGWLAGLLLTGDRPWRNFRMPPPDPADPDPLAGGTGAAIVGQIAVLAMVLATALFVWDRSRLAWQPVLAGSLLEGVSTLALVSGAILVLGGMAGLARLALVSLALMLAMAVTPALTEAARQVESLSAWLATWPGMQAWPVLREALLPAEWTHPALAALVLAFLAGLAIGHASAQALSSLPRRSQRGAAAFAGAALALSLCGLVAAGDNYLAGFVQGGLARTAPAQWPAFVFDPAIRGWLLVCGQWPQDPLAAAVACNTGTARALLPAQALAVEPRLARPALAMAMGWPVLAGHIWALLPVWLALVGFLALVHTLATGLSERGLFRLLRPRALRSDRLLHGRLAVLALAIGMALLERQVSAFPQAAIIWLMAGSVLLLGHVILVLAVEAAVRRWRRPALPVAPAVASPREAT